MEGTDRNDAGKCGTFRHIPKSNENKERGLISSLNDYSWVLQAGTLTSIGVLSDGIMTVYHSYSYAVLQQFFYDHYIRVRS